MAAAMDRHHGECPRCAADLAEMRRIYGLLASPELNVEPPGYFHDNVMRKVRLAQREKAKTARGFFASVGWGWTTAGAMAVAALFVAVVLSVGPLGEGLSAGFGLSRQPAQTVAPTLLEVRLPDAPLLTNQHYPITVNVVAPKAGDWVLLAQASPHLAVTSGTPDAAGDVAVWRGSLATGQPVTALVSVYASTPHIGGLLNLRLESADGSVVARKSVAILPGERADAEAEAQP